MLALLLAAAASAAMPAPLKTFTDWIVGCDNGRACQAVALVPESEERDAYLLLQIRRDAGAAAVARLVLHAEARAVPRAKYTLQVDGRAAAVFGIAGTALDADVPLVPKLTALLADGKRATLVDAKGRRVATGSLGGLAAALLYIDDAQHRLGTVTALRRAGSAPAGACRPRRRCPKSPSRRVAPHCRARCRSRRRPR